MGNSVWKNLCADPVLAKQVESLHMSVHGDICARDELLSRIKNRLHEAVLAKTGGEILTFSNKEFTVSYEDFLSGPEGWDWCHVASGSGDVYEYEHYFPGCNIYWFVSLLGGLYIDMAGDDVSFRRTMEDAIEEFLAEGRMGEDARNSQDEAEILRQTAIALRDAMNGDYAKAMKNSEIEAFVNGLSRLYCDIAEPWFLLENLDTFMLPMVYGNPDEMYRVCMISSHEIWQYRKYRTAVPEAERLPFDTALGVLEDDEASNGWGVCSGEMDRLKTSVFVWSYCYTSYNTDCYEEDCMHPFFMEALTFLVEHLPALREAYGMEEQDALFMAA